MPDSNSWRHPFFRKEWSDQRRTGVAFHSTKEVSMKFPACESQIVEGTRTGNANGVLSSSPGLRT